MKTKTRTKYPTHKNSVLELKESAAVEAASDAPMVRTQIYLSKAEHAFVAAEARRRDEPMAAVIRSFIDARMEIPEDAWTNNPMLKPWPHDPEWKGHEDGGINHDHYIYGCPKKWMKRNGEWVETPPLPGDYYTNPKSRLRYDREVNRST